MAYAGIDLGGTYVKSGLVDSDDPGATMVARTPTPYLRSQGGAAGVIDADALLALVRQEAERLASAGAQGILISNQMHGVVLVDDALSPISPVYTWQADLAAHLPGGTRGVVDAIAGRLGEPTRRALGNELRPGLPIVTLACLARSDGSGMDGATALSVGDFVTSTLSGRVVPCHTSNAAASGVFDLERGEWSATALDAIGASGIRMPDVLSQPEVVGHALVGERSLPVACAIGDQQASLAGADLADDELSVNIATGCQVSRRLGRADTSAPQLRPYLHDDYLATVTHIPAGRALNAFVRLLSGRDPGDDLAGDWTSLEHRARDAAGGVRANVAVFPAARDYPGCLEGLTEDTMTPGSVFRAAMEDVADRIAHAAGMVGTAGMERIAFSGGLAFRSELMRDMVTQRIGLPARVVGEDADALSGLARVARMIPAH